MGDHEGTLQIEKDDFGMKKKLSLTRFEGIFGTLRFNEKSFFITFWVLHHIVIINLPMQFMLIARVCIPVKKF